MPRDLLKLRNRPSLLVVILTIMVSATWTTASRAEPVSATSDIAIDHGAAVTNTENDEKELPQKAVEIGPVFGFPITNSMLVSWIAALGLIVFAQLATRKMQQVPRGAQNFLEWLVESLYGFLEGILGPHLVKRTFWFFATVFIFILCADWVGLIPGAVQCGPGFHGPRGQTGAGRRNGSWF